MYKLHIVSSLTPTWSCTCTDPVICVGNSSNVNRMQIFIWWGFMVSPRRISIVWDDELTQTNYMIYELIIILIIVNYHIFCKRKKIPLKNLKNSTNLVHIMNIFPPHRKNFLCSFAWIRKWKNKNKKS